MKVDTVHKRLVLAIDKQRLQGAPGFDKDAWPNMGDATWEKNLHAHYGTQANAAPPQL